MPFAIIRWSFLTDEEKNRFHEYNVIMSKLLDERLQKEHAERAEQQIKALRCSMDLFIIKLYEKYVLIR